MPVFWLDLFLFLFFVVVVVGLIVLTIFPGPTTSTDKVYIIISVIGSALVIVCTVLLVFYGR